jgi:hypothetical protein
MCNGGGRLACDLLRQGIALAAKAAIPAEDGLKVDFPTAVLTDETEQFIE